MIDLITFVLLLAVLIGGAIGVFIAVGGFCTELHDMFQAHGPCGAIAMLAVFTFLFAMQFRNWTIALAALATIVLMVSLANLFGPKA